MIHKKPKKYDNKNIVLRGLYNKTFYGDAINILP